MQNHYHDDFNKIVDKIEDDFHRLRNDYRELEGFKEKLEQSQSKGNKQQFENAWEEAKGYNNLKQYCGGLASIMPGTSTVEADFSLINWTKDPNCNQLTDFSLESILHCKQHKRMKRVLRTSCNEQM